MADLLPKVLLYTLAPMAAAIIGGSIAAFRTPSPNMRSSIQHFAAGVVFAALGVEILPDVVHHRAPVAAIIGFVLGTALMFGLKWGAVLGTTISTYLFFWQASQEVEEGSLRLSGVAPTWNHRCAVVAAAGFAHGIREVIANLKIVACA